MAACVVAAVAIWWAIFEPKLRVSLWSLLVLLTLLAVAFGVGRLYLRGCQKTENETLATAA